MKLVEHFDTFMRDVVNLNQTRVGLLEDSVEALKGYLRSSDWKPRITTFVAQGSWAHKTIIRPVENKSFDADLLVFADPVPGWAAKDYLSTLRATFAASDIYKDKVTRSSHCVTIEYVGERKIDIAPCVVNRDGLVRLEVCNFDTDEFETSEPKKYTDWLVERNGYTGGNGLRKATRLLKYLRDIKGTFTCPSFVLTTLLGMRIAVADEYNTLDFADLPSALNTIVNRLDDWLQANPAKPTVTNPVLPSEVQSDVWDDGNYATFREKIGTYRTWINDAFSEGDRDESVGKWRRVFGDEFASSVVIEQAASVSSQARQLLEKTALVPANSVYDLVSLFSRFGLRALPPGFDRLPHKQRPRWRQTQASSFQIVVTATHHHTRGGGSLGIVTPESGPLPRDTWLQFHVRTNMGTPLSSDYDIHWRVANTDEAARKANCLRGGFEESNEGSTRWERLEYRGVHTVEAFVVRKRDQALVATSAPFYVVIG